MRKFEKDNQKQKWDFGRLSKSTWRKPAHIHNIGSAVNDEIGRKLTNRPARLYSGPTLAGQPEESSQEWIFANDHGLV